MSREQILGRLKAASWTEGRLPAPVLKPIEPQAGDVDLFITKVQAAGAQVVERAAGLEAARELLAGIIKEQNITRIIGANDPAVEGLRLPELAAQDGFTYYTSAQLKGKEYRDYVTSAQMGITGCTYGVAETGTLVLTHHHDNERLVSHAPDHYVGIIFREQILDDRFSLSAILQAETAPPAAWTLVTGVSRTADVAMQVVLGMHGPRRVTVIIIG